MPEIFRFFGFSFFFYSKEYEPIHVHVEGEDGFANTIIQKQALNCVKAKVSKPVV